MDSINEIENKLSKIINENTDKCVTYFEDKFDDIYKNVDINLLIKMKKNKMIIFMMILILIVYI